ncbi:MAG: TolB family protein, partial [Chloroflexota bacterium]
QMTDHPSVNHHLYFLTRSVTADGRLIFASYRSGQAQLYMARFPDGEIVQLTDGPPVHGFSPHHSPDDATLYFVRNTPQAAEVWALEMPSLRERRLAAFPGGQLGELALSHDGRFAVSALKQHGRYHLALLSPDGGEPSLIHSQERTIIHPQFSPVDTTLIEFAGDPAPRMHLIRHDGSGLRLLYEHTNDEFVVHECFLTGHELAFTYWPHALRKIDLRSGEVSDVARFTGWHIAPDHAGRRVLCDTAHPDVGLQIVDVATGARRTLCYPEASNGGTQWQTSRYALAEDFAAAAARGAEDRGQALSWMEMKTDTVYGPQWTHPHPSWSPDERRVVFTSDRTGHAQVYVVDVQA